MANTAEVNAKSITERGMTVRLYLSGWSARKYDRRATEEVAIAHGVRSDAGRYNKQLLAKGALEEIQRIDSEWRTWHYKVTLPWEEPYRLLPARMFFEYTDGTNTRKLARQAALDTFLSAYPDYVADARVRLNGLFKDEDYPPVSEVARKFGCDVSFLPIPQGDQFAVFLDSHTAEIQADIDARVNARLEDATRDSWERIHTAVARMVERLNAYGKDSDGKVTGKFHDSLVENVRELVEILPRLNITGDARLDAMCKRLETELCYHSADMLRADPLIRRDVAAEAQAILDEVGSMFS